MFHRNFFTHKTLANVNFKAVHGEATRQARPIRLEKRAHTDNIFEKILKFGQVIPARQDKLGVATQKKPAVYPPARLV